MSPAARSTATARHRTRIQRVYRRPRAGASARSTDAGHRRLGSAEPTGAIRTGSNDGASAPLAPADSDAAVGLGRIRAVPGCRVADVPRVALTRGVADDRVATQADARLARITSRAGVPVVAGRAVGLRGSGADAAGWIAPARLVALIRRAADDRGTARAG